VPEATTEAILESLVALNSDRSVEEANGTIRYIRPKYLARGTAKKTSRTLGLEWTAPSTMSATLQWPDRLSDQVVSVASVLAGARRPLAAAEVARAFAGKRAATVAPVLDALAAIGQARWLGDGRYAS
jgi:hypothetical protein